MKGWLYVISNKAVFGLVKVGSTPKDPVAYAESLERSGLPYPYSVGYEALVPDMAEADRLVVTALASKAEGKGWFKCSVAAAVREITIAIGKTVLVENLYDGEALADRWCVEVTSTDPTRRANALADPGCPLNVLKFAIEREQDESVMLGLVGNPAVKVLKGELADMVDRCSGYGRLIAAMASDPGIPSEALLRILGIKTKEDVLLELVRNPSFPKDGFADAISEHFGNDNVMDSLTAHPSCPAESLAQICWLSSSNANRRKATRIHANWSEIEFLERLRDESEETPDWVAEHPDCPADLLRSLSEEGLDARAAVLGNPNCPEDLLVKATLAGVTETRGDETFDWADIASGNPSNPITRAGCANASAETLRTLSGSRFPAVVLAVAENAKCPVDVLTRFASCERRDIRAAVANRQDCPDAVIRKLAGDGAPEVRRAVLQNPGCPKDLLDAFASSDLYEWRMLVAKLENCPEEILDRLCLDTDPSVRTIASRRKSAGAKASAKSRPQRTETLEVVRERFRQYVRRTLGALIEESELLRLASLPANEKEAFAKEYPSHAKQLALFEKHLLPKLRPAGS